MRTMRAGRVKVAARPARSLRRSATIDAAAGAIFDATGSYDWALVMFAIASGASALLFWVASRLPRPVEQRARSRSDPPAEEPIEFMPAPIPAGQR